MSIKDDQIETVSRKPHVLRLLRRLHAQRGRLWLAPTGEQGHHPVAVLDLDEDREALITDIVPGSKGERIRQADTLDATTSMDGIRTWFEIPRWLRIQEGGEDYYAIPYPETIYRLQRRDAFRIQLPMTNQAQCRLCIGGSEIETRIRDLAVGGVGVTLEGDDDTLFDTGEIIEGVKITSDFGLNADGLTIEIRHVSPAPEKGKLRVGCRFLSPDPMFTQQLQQTIQRLQLEQIQQGS